MKSLLVPVFILLFFPLKAQVGLSLGPRATYDLNTYKANAEDQFGFTAGAVFQMKVSRIFYFDSGLFWVQKRFLDPTVPCNQSNAVNCHDHMTGHYDYLQLPLLLRVNLTPFGNYRPYVAAGIAGGRLMNRTSFLEFPDGTTEDFPYEMHEWMFFFFLRAGLDFEVSKKMNFLLEAHGSYTSPSETFDPGSNFVSVGVGVGLFFDLNGDPEHKLPDY